MTAKGFVSLVGAGPGVKDHLTYRAVDRLERADLVLYDALVDPSLLDLAGDAQRFFVGKRAGRHSMSQSTIEALLIRHAREGKRVVRLKAGDPFVFGRGGEEALALAAAEIPYEVVPGISSALSAPMFGGIPVTHRGISSACTLVSGHASDTYGPLLDAIPPHQTTFVFLMGYANRAAISQQLMARGWSSSTATAMVAGAGTPHQQVWRGQLQDLVSTSNSSSTYGEYFDTGGAPVTLVVGDSVSLSDVISKPAPVDLSEDYEPVSATKKIERVTP